MRPSTFLALATALLAPAADAYIERLGFPSTIQPGVPFDVYYEQLLSQPTQLLAVFGITKRQGSYVGKGEIGSALFKTAFVQGMRLEVLVHHCLKYHLCSRDNRRYDKHGELVRQPRGWQFNFLSPTQCLMRDLAASRMSH